MIYYGRNDIIQKITISVVDDKNNVIEIKRYWVADGWTQDMIALEAKKLFHKYGVKRVVMTDPTKDLMELNVNDPEDFNCEPFLGDRKR